MIALRPKPSHLCKLPTLKTWGVAGTILELKKVCQHHEFWLCTETTEAVSWKQGQVIQVPLEPDESGEFSMMPYGEEDIPFLHEADYRQALVNELTTLLEKAPSCEEQKRIDEVRQELKQIFQQQKQRSK